jgi:hypothetical protein
MKSGSASRSPWLALAGAIVFAGGFAVANRFQLVHGVLYRWAASDHAHATDNFLFLALQAAALLIAIVLLGLLGAVAWHFTRARDCTLRISVRANAGQPTAQVIDAERDSGLTHSQLLSTSGDTVLELRQMKPWERWHVSLRFDGRSSNAIELKGCPAITQDRELEEAHVRIDPP